MALVFVVDDDPLVTESLGTALRLETPYDVRTFNSGADALAELDRVAPDVVLSDFKMGGLDGLSLLRAVRGRCPDAVLMLLTGYADKESAIAAINEVNLYQYVEKPWQLDDLLHKIRAGLEKQALVKTLRERNAELQQAHEQLVSAERLGAVGRVVSGLAHEIGNQLALVGYAEAIKARAEGKDRDIFEFADVIVTAQKRLAAMVTEIKDFTRGQTSAAVALEPADVGAVVDESLAILRYDRDVGRCRIVRDFQARPLARLHRGKFAQVILNLVRNAAQASRPEATINVSLAEQGGVRLVITDEGSGMSPDVLARLGEPFFTTRGERGTGLGVGICRRIVAEHGGQIAFDSTVGKGTRVTVTLPTLSS